VLRNRSFALLWGGQTISWFGDSLYFVALLWLVQELTGSRAMSVSFEWWIEPRLGERRW
jgi:hypothetical protein